MSSPICKTILRKICSLTVGLIAFAAVSLTAQQSTGQEKQAMSAMAADAHPRFEVATIKPSSPDSVNGNFHIGGHRLYIDGQTVNSLMAFAYNLHPKQITGGPSWLDTQRFDIVGQADVEGAPNLSQIQEMIQRLLADRFNLRFYQERRELPIYAITVAKGGPKLTRSASSGNLPFQTGSRINGEQVRRFTNNSLSDFAVGMQSFLDRPVMDQTGITGRYDFVLTWTPEETAPAESKSSPGLFTAIQEQLGLKLEPTKGPADVFVVERVELPSGN